MPSRFGTSCLLLFATQCYYARVRGQMLSTQVVIASCLQVPQPALTEHCTTDEKATRRIDNYRRKDVHAHRPLRFYGYTYISEPGRFEAVIAPCV